MSVLSEMDPPADLDRGAFLTNLTLLGRNGPPLQIWFPLSITLPFVFKFKFDNAIENNVILSFIPRI